MKIIGTGSAVPSLVVTNEMLESFLDTSNEWIVTRTGIERRKIMSSEHLEDLAAAAAAAAISDAGLKATDIDYIIVSNVVNEYITPGLGCIIQGKIGATCPTIDINGACAGFVYALDIADTFLAARKYKNILVVCAEEPTRMVDWTERSTCVLFGDGAGAVVLTAEDGLKSIRLTTTSRVESLYQMRNLQPTPFNTNEKIDNEAMVMVGQDIFKMAVKTSINDINIVIAEANTTVEEVDYFIIHQANTRIIESIRTNMKQPVSKFPKNIGKRGNSSSASIPILLDELNKSNTFKNGDKIVFSAFGAGFTSGACLIEWSLNK